MMSEQPPADTGPLVASDQEPGLGAPAGPGIRSVVLLPCPFCGCQPQVFATLPKGWTVRFGHADDCVIAHLAGVNVSDLDEFTRHWNTRPAEAMGERKVAGGVREARNMALEEAANIVGPKEGGEYSWLANRIRARIDASLTPPPASVDRKDVPHVFLDCDGVLADFDKAGELLWGMHPREYEAKVGSKQFWHELENQTDFYGTLPLMPDAMDLFNGVKHLHPTILTGCPRGNWAQGQKVAWAAKHFPGVPIITCRSADKRDYAKPGDVLIDDWAQHRHRWIEMGGVFINHHDAASSLATLWAHYPALAQQETNDGE